MPDFAPSMLVPPTDKPFDPERDELYYRPAVRVCGDGDGEGGVCVSRG